MTDQAIRPSVLNRCILFCNKLKRFNSKLCCVPGAAFSITPMAAFHTNKFKSFMVPYCLSHHNQIVFQPFPSKLKQLRFMTFTVGD